MKIDVIFILIIGLVPSQQREAPNVRSTTLAERQPYNLICDNHSRAKLLTPYITPMINSRKNKTQNYPTVLEAKLFMEENIYVIFTEDAIISTSKGLLLRTSILKCETIVDCWGRSLQVLNTTIRHFRKVAPELAPKYENDLNAAIADVAIITEDIYRATADFPLLALQSSLNKSTYDHMFSAAGHVAYGVVNMSSIYLQKMNSPIVLLCVDHQNNGTRSNLSQIFPPNNQQMYNSKVTAEQIILQIPSLYAETPANIEESTNDAYNNMKASAIVIEEQCLLPVTTTDFEECTKPARRDYASWGMQARYRYGCTFDLPQLIINIDALHEEIHRVVPQFIDETNSFVENDIELSFTHVNSTAIQIQDQLKAAFDGDNCQKVAPHAKTMYEALVTIVQNAYSGLAVCATNIPTDMDIEANIIMTEYHNAQNSLQSKIDQCLSDVRGFDECMIEFDVTFPQQLPLIYTALQVLSGVSKGETCKTNVETTFATSVQALLNNFETSTGVKIIVT